MTEIKKVVAGLFPTDLVMNMKMHFNLELTKPNKSTAWETMTGLERIKQRLESIFHQMGAIGHVMWIDCLWLGAGKWTKKGIFSP